MDNIKSKIENIQKTTRIKVDNCKVINKGSESLILEINDKWIFRFPRTKIHREKMQKRLSFLNSFSKVSPISIPEPKYTQDDFIGYKKISGEPFLPTQIVKLSVKDKNKIAKQLGLFLKSLHNHKHKQIYFNTGYLVMRKSDYNAVPKQIAKYLNSYERKVLLNKIKAIASNPLNFKKPTTIIHGDLNFNNILWDRDRKTITGILDWSDMGLGIPAMDFIALADFNKESNDDFLRQILDSYGAKNDDLFNQIKESAIIEVLNWFWFYLEAKNQKGVSRMVKKLKKILSKNMS